MSEEENQSIGNEKDGRNMTLLSQYLEKNKEQAYALASSNTKHNIQGRPMVSKDDEWVSETEWDDLFDILKNKKVGRTNE